MSTLKLASFFFSYNDLIVMFQKSLFITKGKKYRHDEKIDTCNDLG